LQYPWRYFAILSSVIACPSIWLVAFTWYQSCYSSQRWGPSRPSHNNGA